MPIDPSLSPVARLVRRHDRDRFLTSLFAPAGRREDLLALYAFNYEVAKTREVVTEPTLGRIRLAWWRENLDAIYAGAPSRRHEVVEPLAAAVRRHSLSRPHLDRLIEAREFDLADEPPASLEALEDYVESSAGRLVWLALEVLDERGEAVLRAGRSVGIAYGLSGLLRAIPFHARSKRLYLPRDLCEVAGLRLERDLFELRSSPALRHVVARVAELAETHLAAARSLAAGVPKAALPAMLPAVLANADLARLKRADYDPFAPRMARPDARRSWRLALAAFRGRY
jgi:NADH dehydrogenase [ubiquinone] 1 alpha subcomplex assembly factor 6